MGDLYGWAGKILSLDLSKREIGEIFTMDYASRFIGGRGISAKIYWDDMVWRTGAFDPENKLILMTGPLAGTPSPSASRWQICSKSPMAYPEQYSYGNLGGYWGAELKFAGYDGMVISGKAEEPVYIWIEDHKVEIRAGSHLWGLKPIQVVEKLREELGRDVRIVTMGPAGERLVRIANLVTDDGASTTNGFGAVMGSKNLKALAIRGRGRVLIARQKDFSQIFTYIRDRFKPSMEKLPFPGVSYVRQIRCFGCLTGCIRAIYRAPSGEEGKGMCQAIFYYQPWDQRYHGRPTETAFLATRLADDYGLCTKDLGSMISWLDSCYKENILTEADTGLPLSKIGSLEFIKTLMEKISLREGFGNILAEGVLRAAKSVGKESEAVITDYVSRTGFTTTYSPRLYITTGLFYATEPRQPIQHLHEIGTLIQKWVQWVNGGEEVSYVSSEVVRAIAKRFWGSETAADFSTYEGKALAAVRIQDRQYAKECLILCDFFWPLRELACSEDHVGDPSVESKIFFAVTGINMDEEGLYRVGERVFNLQRAIMLLEGRRGRRDDILEEFNFSIGVQNDTLNPDCIVPGPQGAVFSRKGMVLERDKFEQMKDEYYYLRGWDIETGLPKENKLEELGLTDIAQKLKIMGLIV